MSWITILWSMNAAASLSLAAMYFVVWLHRRKDWYLWLFSCSAVSSAAIAMLELASMHATTPEQYLTILRWAHIPFTLMIVCSVWFVFLYLRAGRRWLAWAVSIVRTLALGLNFVFSGNLNFRAITGLGHKAWWGGETVATPIGITNPWTIVGQFSLLLFIVFAADAMLTVWRRGDRRVALMVGGSILLFIIVTTTQIIWIFWGNAPTPFFVSFAFLGIIGAMAWELSRDVLRAAKLNDDLRELREQMRLAASATHLAIWNWDVVRDEISVADEGRALYGLAPREKLTGSRFLETIHPRDRSRLQAIVNQVGESHEVFNLEYRVVPADGSERWIIATGWKECDAAGIPVRMRGFSFDVTARKLSELQIKQQRDEVAHLSRVIMLGELSGSLAHELSQPLGAILRNAEAAEMLMQSPKPDLNELREIVADIRRDDQRAGDVIDRLRALLKRRELAPQPFPLEAMIGDVRSLVQADAVNRHIGLDVADIGNLPLVLGDRIHLQQVLLNLVLNGMDALAHTEGIRKLQIRAREPGDGMVEISVADNGHGIPVEQLERLFEPFFTTKEQGMGMGLAISRTIVLAHGGDLRAENNPDRGATFRFTLPLAKETCA